jgi:aspartate/methionine/tyrosine aminotransferase
VIPTYRSQEWLFDVAAGRSDVDLAVSGMESRSVKHLLESVSPACGYDIDRGAAPLREAIAGRYGVPANQVMITHGAQEALYLLYAALLRPGDDVVVRSPGWQQTTDLPVRFGAATRDATIDIADRDSDGATRTLEQVTPNTRMIVLNSPHNPTGLAWDDGQWKTLAEGVPGGVLVVNDEEYLTDETASTLHRVPGSAVVSSLSKVYGFPGLRLGWLVGTPEVVEACVNYRRYTTISNSPLLEALALQVLQHQDQYLAEYHSRLAAGWKVFGEWSSGQPGLEPVEPQGTPFVLCRVTIDGLSSQQLCLDALDQERLLLMPGDVFGAPGYVRISYARPEELLRDGLDRLAKVLERR